MSLANSVILPKEEWHFINQYFWGKNIFSLILLSLTFTFFIIQACMSKITHSKTWKEKENNYGQCPWFPSVGFHILCNWSSLSGDWAHWPASNDYHISKGKESHFQNVVIEDHGFDLVLEWLSGGKGLRDEEPEAANNCTNTSQSGRTFRGHHSLSWKLGCNLLHLLEPEVPC